MMLHIVTDGAADFPPGWREQLQVHVIPINIHIGDRQYLQGIDMDDDMFYQVVEREGVVPKTSQPSPYQFVQFYQRIARPGDTILSLHVTAKLSGTYASAVAAARQLADKLHIFPFDTGCGSAGMAFMCAAARRWAEQGLAVETILARLAQMRRRVSVILTLDSLDYARMSGRVKALQAALASMLRIKPIVELRDGWLEASGRVRTRRRALEEVVQRMKDRVGEHLVDVAVVHARAPEAAAWLRERVQQVFRLRQLVTTNLSIAVAANLGPGTTGLVAVPVVEAEEG